MSVPIFVALFVALVAVVFALQNSMVVSVSFLVWRFSGSLALILLLTLAVGFLVGWLAALPTIFRLRRERMGLRKEVARLEEKLAEERTRLEMVVEAQARAAGEKEQQA